MAIAGLLVHALKDDLARIEGEIKKLPEMTTYGCHQDQFIVVVADAPSDRLEASVGKIETDIDGVLTIYTTYVTTEDELPDNGETLLNSAGLAHSA